MINGKPHTPPLVILSPEFSSERHAFLFCFICLFSFSFLFSWVEFMTAFNLRKGNVCGISADPFPAPTFTFWFLLILTENWWDCGEFSTGFVKISSRECNAWRGTLTLDWNPTSDIFFLVLKSVFFHFGLSSSCYCTTISPATVSAHSLRFLYDGVEKAGGMINGQENHRLMLSVIVMSSSPIIHASPVSSTMWHCHFTRED